MVVGSPPFYSKNRQLTFRLILSAEINFPEGMDAHCVHLIRALLTREPKKRLGRYLFASHAALAVVSTCVHRFVCSGSHGAADVRAHPFFESIDWAALMTKTLPPPFVPQTSSLPLNFDERYMKRTPVDRCQLAHLSLFVSSHCTARLRRRNFQRRRRPLPLSKILHTCNRNFYALSVVRQSHFVHVSLCFSQCNGARRRHQRAQ
jgi:hypothetical protein